MKTMFPLLLALVLPLVAASCPEILPSENSGNAGTSPTLTVHNCPKEKFTASVHPNTSLPANKTELIKIITTGEVIAAASGTSPFMLSWAGPVQSGHRLLILSSPTIMRFTVTTFDTTGSSITDWNAMTDYFLFE